ncbi:MAG: TRAP transporter small permease subunit [Synergistaceae bacterium]|nr:TRAP transporter small permease subunit [Synergistaceae bacterium]
MKKCVKIVVRLQEAAGTLLLAVFFAAILAQIMARYMKIPLLWTEELANYSFIWAVFMGASVMVYYKAHFCFTFFKDYFKGRMAAVYDIFVCAILLTFTVPMFLYGVNVTWTFWNYNWITLPWIRMGYTWLCLPIMGFTMSFYIMALMLEDLQVVLRRNA